MTQAKETISKRKAEIEDLVSRPPSVLIQHVFRNLRSLTMDFRIEQGAGMSEEQEFQPRVSGFITSLQLGNKSKVDVST